MTKFTNIHYDKLYIYKYSEVFRNFRNMLLQNAYMHFVELYIARVMHFVCYDHSNRLQSFQWSSSSFNYCLIKFVSVIALLCPYIVQYSIMTGLLLNQSSLQQMEDGGDVII